MHRPLNSAVGNVKTDHFEQPVDLCSVLTACAEDQREAWSHLHTLLCEAAEQRAYEIHIEPDEDCWRIRYRSPFNFSETRIDSTAGYQQTLTQLQDHLWQINDPRSARRALFEFPVYDISWLLRIDVVPSARGQTYRITLLRPSKEPSPRLDSLALSREQHTQIRSVLHERKGLLILAGDLEQPRLQTARALVQEMVAPDRKIVCADSAGHPLFPRTTQLTIDTPPTSAQRNTWSAMCQLGCDAIVSCQLFNDDIDRQLISHASRDTVVIQSIPGSTAADALERMLSIGIRSEALARTLSAIVVQRQVQCICRYCRQSQVPDDDGTAWLAEHSPIKAGNINDWLRHRMRSSFSQAQGCEKCGETGLGSVLDIFDVVPVGADVRDALYDTDIRYALSLLSSRTSLSTHLLNLAQEGIISLTEAVRVAPLAASND